MFKVASVDSVGTSDFATNLSAVVPSDVGRAPKNLIAYWDYDRGIFGRVTWYQVLSWSAPLAISGVPVKDYILTFKSLDTNTVSYLSLTSTSLRLDFPPGQYQYRVEAEYAFNGGAMVRSGPASEWYQPLSR